MQPLVVVSIAVLEDFWSLEEFWSEEFLKSAFLQDEKTKKAMQIAGRNLCIVVEFECSKSELQTKQLRNSKTPYYYAINGFYLASLM